MAGAAGEEGSCGFYSPITELGRNIRHNSSYAPIILPERKLMPDDVNIIGKLDIAIHAVEEIMSLAAREGLETEESALADALATLQRIREKALDDIAEGATVLKRALRVRKPLVLKKPGA